MSEKKRYYWIKMRTDFFDSGKIKTILRMEGGFEYFTFYCMLKCRCANQSGEICMHSASMGRIPYSTEDIRGETQNLFSAETVEKAFEILEKEGLIEKTSGGIYRFTDYDTMVGDESSTAAAEKQRKYRERKREYYGGQDKLLSREEDGETQDSRTFHDRDGNALRNVCYTEKDKEKDIDKEKDTDRDRDTDKDKTGPGADALCVCEIVSYLNEKAGTSFSDKNGDTLKLLRRRIREGYTSGDMKKVIDRKVADWTGTYMQRFLRPQTLFGNKFESYLNERTDESMPPGKKDRGGNPYFEVARELAAAEKVAEENMIKGGFIYEVE